MSEKPQGGFGKILRRIGLAGSITAAGIAGGEIARKPIEHGLQEAGEFIEGHGHEVSMGVVVGRKEAGGQVELVIQLTEPGGKEGRIMLSSAEAAQYQVESIVRVRYDDAENGIDIDSLIP